MLKQWFSNSTIYQNHPEAPVKTSPYSERFRFRRSWWGLKIWFLTSSQVTLMPWIRGRYHESYHNRERIKKKKIDCKVLYIFRTNEWMSQVHSSGLPKWSRRSIWWGMHLIATAISPGNRVPHHNNNVQSYVAKNSRGGKTRNLLKHTLKKSRRRSMGRGRAWDKRDTDNSRCGQMLKWVTESACLETSWVPWPCYYLLFGK